MKNGDKIALKIIIYKIYGFSSPASAWKGCSYHFLVPIILLNLWKIIDSLSKIYKEW